MSQPLGWHRHLIGTATAKSTAPAYTGFRFASPRNRIADDCRSASSRGGTARDCYANRITHWIGSGDMSQLVLSFSGWSLSTSGALTTPTGSYTILSAAWESVNLAVSVPIYFGGSRSKTISALDTDIQCDPILPSAFSLSKFTRGEQYFLRINVQVSVVGNTVPVNTAGVMYTGESAIGFALGSSNVDPVDSTGIRGVNSGDAGSGYRVAHILLGKFVTGDPVTIMGIGDSIMYGLNDDVNPIFGYFQKSLFDANLTSGHRGGCNFGISSGVANAWSSGNSALVCSYLKYGKHAIEEYGTNGGTVAQSQAIWNALRAANVGKIIRTRVTPRTTTTNSWMTPAGQTYNAAYQPGQQKAIFNTDLQALLGIGFDTYFDCAAVVDSVDPWKWAGDGTTANLMTDDGLHPSTNGHSLLAASLRTIYAGWA